MRAFGKFLLWAAVVIGVVVGLARLTALRWWQLPEDDPILTTSVSPTLFPGDWVILWRLTKPNYGDLVVCDDPKNEGELVIGRIVGEANDQVKVQGQDLWVNQSLVRSERACTQRTFKTEDPNTGKEVEQHCAEVDLGGQLHMRGNISEHRSQSSTLVTEMKLGEGQVFLLSDNRLYPFDSRRYGAVERATCRESALLRLVSREGWSDVNGRLTWIR